MKLDDWWGEKNRRAKLTTEQARQIKKEYAEGKRGKDNAKRFGVTPETYNKIGRNCAWRHVYIHESKDA